MADGDRYAVPLTKMERMSSKLKRSMQAAAQVGSTVAESSLTAAALTKESSRMAASLATQITKGTAEMALGIDDSGTLDDEHICDVAPHCEIGIEAGLANRDAVVCIGANQQADTVWACGNASIRICSIELQRAEVVDVKQYVSAGVRPKALCIVGVGRRIFTGHDDGSLCAVDTSDSAGVLAPAPLVFREEGISAPLTAAVGVGEHEIWVADGAGVVRVWEMTAHEGQSVTVDRATATLCLTDGSSGHQQAVQALASAYGERGVVWSCSADTTRVWDAWQRTCRMTVDRCTDAYSCVSSTDGVDEFVWTGHGNGSVLKWHGRTAELLLVVPAAEMTSRIPGVARPIMRKRTVRCLLALSEFGDVWVGCTDGYVRVYDIATGALQRSWQAHHSSITGMCVAHCSGVDSLKVCTASQRGAHIRVWHADLKQQDTARPDTESHGIGGGAGGAAGILRGIAKRNLSFNFYACAEQQLPDSVPLFDHFIVCGTRDESAADPAEWLLKSIGAAGNRGAAGEPEILWHVPSVEGQQLNLPKIEDFCFPMARDLDDGPKQWLGVPNIPLGDTQPFAFLLTSSPDGGTPFTLYCCCQYVMPAGADAGAEPWCFCFISRYPFFALHFHVLRLLANAQSAGDAMSTLDAGGNLLSPMPAASRYGGGFFEEEGSGLLSSPASAMGDDDLISFFTNSPSRGVVPPPPVAPDAIGADDPFMALATRDSSPIMPPSVAPAGEASPPAVGNVGVPSLDDATDKPDFSMPKVGERILDAYKATHPPARGVVTTVSFFPDSDPCSFNRPRRDEMCSAKLGLLSTLQHLSTHNFLRLFACVLLERQIVVTGDSVAALADTVVSLPPLLKPYFQWHSMLMPGKQMQGTTPFVYICTVPLAGDHTGTSKPLVSLVANQVRDEIVACTNQCCRLHRTAGSLFLTHQCRFWLGYLAGTRLHGGWAQAALGPPDLNQTRGRTTTCSLLT